MDKIVLLTAELLEASNRSRHTKHGPKPFGVLRPNEIKLLLFLKSHSAKYTQGLTVSNISEKLGVTSSAVTQVLNHIEKLGFIDKTTDEKDRRHVRITLTEQGIKTVADFKSEMTEETADLVEFLGEEDTKTLIRLLNRITEFYSTKNIDK